MEKKKNFWDDTDIRPSYDTEPMVEVPYTTEYNMFAVDTQHSEQPECISNTCAVKTGDSNVIPDSPDMCDNDIHSDQNVLEYDDEPVALANLIANLKLDVDENKTIQKQLKKANTSLTQELKECKSTLAETSRTLGESNSIRDSCLVALQNKQTEFERYKAFNDRTVDYDKLERKLNETLGLLAQKDIDIKEGLKVKAYEILVVKEKYDELVKQSLLTKSHYEGLVKQKTKVIKDLKLKEEKDIDKIISMENQLKFLNEIVYKMSQSIQTIHMLAPKCPTFNGRPAFANPMYLKKAQYEIPCLYEIPHNQSDPVNRLIPDREETLTLDKESRSKLNKDLVKPFDYTKEIVDQAWVKHSKDHFRAPTAKDMEILIRTCLMPLAHKTQNDSLAFVHELKKEMHADLKYVESLENEIDELESDKAKFSNMYDMLLQEYLKAQLQDKNIAISELKKLNERMKGKSVDTNFEKHSILGKPPSQPIRNKSSIRQPTAYKSERSQLLRHRFASQVGVSHNLTKLVTPHSWPQVRKSYFAKPYDVNAPGPSTKCPKHVSFQSPKESVGSNDMVHNYYLEEAKKKAQLQNDKTLNMKPRVQQSVRSPNIANGNKLKPRNFNQQPRN
ncbi:hypothetical protein Tco_1053236 [Tanacetum coccineum]